MNVIAIDHVQFGVRHVAEGARYLERHGYKLNFAQPKFNCEARSYFHGVAKDMAYLARGGCRVELITGAQERESATYVPIFAGLETAAPRPALDLGEFRAFWDHDLCGICAKGPGVDAVLDGVIVRASRPDDSAEFWRLLGFNLTIRDSRWLRLAFPGNALSMPLNILITRERRAPAGSANADDLGCSSVALITKDLHADCALLDREGYAISETTPLRINGRALTICFTAGPSGELVELMQFAGLR